MMGRTLKRAYPLQSNPSLGSCEIAAWLDLQTDHSMISLVLSRILAGCQTCRHHHFELLKEHYIPTKWSYNC